MTYLHYAAFAKNLYACQFLLKRGADPYLRTYNSHYHVDEYAEDFDGCFAADNDEASKPKLKTPGKNAIEMFPEMQDMVNLWYGKVTKMGQLFMSNASVAKFSNVTVITM